MDAPRIVIVHLRRPRKSDPNEMRSDPFWEFGSFGCTRCHSANLLHEKNVARLEGSRLAFAQGGPQGFRLLYLTAPIKIKSLRGHFEAVWNPVEMPFKYSEAPLLISNAGATDVPKLKSVLTRVNRTTLEGAFSSCFRSRVLPLRGDIADQLDEVYSSARRIASAGVIAKCYSEALPYPPSKIDSNREATYERLRTQEVDRLVSGKALIKKSRCRPCDSC